MKKQILSAIALILASQMASAKKLQSSPNVLRTPQRATLHMITLASAEFDRQRAKFDVNALHDGLQRADLTIEYILAASWSVQNEAIFGYRYESILTAGDETENRSAFGAKYHLIETATEKVAVGYEAICRASQAKNQSGDDATEYSCHLAQYEGSETPSVEVDLTFVKSAAGIEPKSISTSEMHSL